jgi:predicted component of type VI protein secretion system
MYSYGIGGQERKLDNASEAISDIPLNRTLLVQKLTTNAPLRPEVVQGLKTPEAVFAHFKPEVAVEFENAEGGTVAENLHFASLGDFGKKGIISQSNFLQGLASETDDMQKLLRQLKSNKILKTALENPETKAAFLAAIQAMMDELQ